MNDNDTNLLLFFFKDAYYLLIILLITIIVTHFTHYLLFQLFSVPFP